MSKFKAGNAGSNPESIIGEIVGSIYLKYFLYNVGNAIHALNTICVGLSNVAEGNARKPDDLVIKWNPKDSEISSNLSRNFAIKSTYVFLAESTYEYMNYVKHVFINESDLKKYDELQNSEKIEKIFSNAVGKDNRYRLVMLKLLVHTRNRIVHNKSKADLSSNERNILKESKNTISINHSNLNIDELLQHFSSNKFTLKDISSHAANNIFMVRKIDEIFISKLKKKEIILELIKEYDIYDEWDKIIKLEKSETKRRKIKHFLEIYFNFIEKEISEQICIEFD